MDVCGEWYLTVVQSVQEWTEKTAATKDMKDPIKMQTSCFTSTSACPWNTDQIAIALLSMNFIAKFNLNSV